MVRLARGIFMIMADEYGLKGVLARLSNPIFFQACSNALGFDWNSSGSTTVTCYTIKQALANIDLGIRTAGGKGKYSRMAKKEIEEIGRHFDLSEEEVAKMRYASKMTAKVDNTAIQAGYQLYHHTIFITKEGDWAVIQQGMNADFKTARRYHWLSNGIENFIVEPHKGIVGDRTHDNVLDMTASQSEGARKISVEMVREGANRLKPLYEGILNRQRLLTDWFGREEEGAPKMESRYDIYSVKIGRIDWKSVEKAWKLEPHNYEELLAISGIGPSTVRGLALISELIFGEPPSWKDPVKYSFAFGGKDGVPFPIDRKVMDGAINLLEDAIYRAKLGDREKYDALNRLATWRTKLEKL